MRELTLREQLLLGLLLLIGLAFGGVYVQKQLAGQEALLQQQLDNRRQQLRQLQALASEWNQLKNRPLAPVMEQPLSAFVEAVARDLKIQDNLQLNALSNPPEGLDGVQVRLDKLNLDDALEVLYRLENNQPVLQIEQLLFSVAPGSRVVRLNFQVFKQSPRSSNSLICKGLLATSTAANSQGSTSIHCRPDTAGCGAACWLSSAISWRSRCQLYRVAGSTPGRPPA